MVWFSPYVTKIPPEMYPVMYMTSGLLVTNLLLAGLVDLPASVLRGMNLGYKRMGLGVGLTVMGGLLSLIAVSQGWGLVGLAAGKVAVALVTGVLFWRIAFQHLSWFGIERPTWSEVQQFLTQSGWFLAWALIDKLLFTCDIVLLAYPSSASAVTTFTVTGYAIQMLAGLTTMGVGATSPGLGGLVGQKQLPKVATLRQEILLYSWLFTTVCGAMILLWNRSFVHLWVGNEHYAGGLTNFLLVLLAIQLIFIRNEAGILDLTLDLRKKVMLGTAAAVLSLGLAFVLTSKFGMIGLCLGLLGGRLVLTISYPLLVNAFLQHSTETQPISWWRPLLVTMVLFAFSAHVGQDLVVKEWTSWGAAAGTSFLLLMACCVTLGLSPKQKQQLFTRVKTVQLLPSV